MWEFQSQLPCLGTGRHFLDTQIWLYTTLISAINMLCNWMPLSSEDQGYVGDLCFRVLLLPVWQALPSLSQLSSPAWRTTQWDGAGEPLLGAHTTKWFVRGMLRAEGVPGAGAEPANSGTLVLGWVALHCRGRATLQLWSNVLGVCYRINRKENGISSWN